MEIKLSLTLEELNVVILALLADIDVAIDELNMVSEA